jgi:HSP20 family protein
VYQDIEKNVVTATFEFPGFSNDDVQINFQNGKLTVSAETKKSDSEEYAETGYTLRERVRGRLLRTLQLPEGVQVYRSLLNILNKC